MVLAVLPMVELVEVAEGVLEPLDHLGTHPDRFLCENRWWNMFQMFIFKNIIGTCCTPHGWAFRGRWGCPRALRSPGDPSMTFCFRKSFMKHISNVQFYEYKWYLLSPHIRILSIAYMLIFLYKVWINLNICFEYMNKYFHCYFVMHVKIHNLFITSFDFFLALDFDSLFLEYPIRLMLMYVMS